MTKGTTHFAHAIATTIATTTAAYFLEIPLTPVILGNLVGTIITPDIDMTNRTFTEDLIARGISKTIVLKGTKKRRNKVKRFFANIIMSLTAPYAFIFPHRSFLTHLPPISVIVQMLYFYGLYYAIGKIFEFNTININELFAFYQANQNFLNILFFTLCIQHFIHLIGDGGLIVVFGKERYIFTKSFYRLSKKLFSSEGRD